MLPTCLDKEKAFELLWQESLIGIAILDQEGYFRAANPALCAMLEFTEEELKTKTFHQVTHPEDLPYKRTLTDRVKDGEIGGFDMPMRYVMKLHGTVTAILRLNRIEEEGQFIFFMSQVAQMDDHHQAVIPPDITSTLTEAPLKKEVEEVIATEEKKDTLKPIRVNWTIIIFIIVTLSGIIAEVIKQLGKVN